MDNYGTQSAIYWQGELVGYMEDPSPDMWYIDGVWHAVDSEIATEFMNLASMQSWRDFQNIQDVDDFIWVGLGENSPNHVFVAFVDEYIRLRIVTNIDPPSTW